MKRFLAMIGCTLILGSAAAAATENDPLVVDLSEHFIKITAGFTGARVLLFGAIEGDGRVVIIVQGPPEDITVRRKEEAAGLIWINRHEVQFATVPSFYRVLSGEPLKNWLPAETRKRHEIGTDYLDIRPIGAKDAAEGEAFRQALLRNMRRTERFGEEERSVKIVDGKLFRADLYLPANVPTGYYDVQVLLIQDGKVRSVQETPLQVNKAGIEDQVYRMAYEYPALYGIAAIIIAVLAGLLANAAFRKV
jgi:uncharacterized protein (TIGR02186 family)